MAQYQSYAEYKDSRGRWLGNVAALGISTLKQVDHIVKKF